MKLQENNRGVTIHDVKQWVCVIALFAGASPALVNPAVANFASKPARSLAFDNLHTGEKLKVEYWTEGEYVPDALGEIECRLLVDGAHAQHHELVTTKPGQGVRGTQAGAQALGDQAQQQVALVVAQGVIERLEVVEVDHQQGAVVTGARASSLNQLEAVHHQAPIGQAGQEIVKDEMGNPCLVPAPFRDIRERRDPARPRRRPRP